MSEIESIAIVGLGEIGRPLFEIVSEKYFTRGIDIGTKVEEKSFDIIHICYPYSGRGFVATTAEYVRRFDPSLVIVNSTVAMGTTRRIHEATGTAIVHSPVRGKHVKMRQEMLSYTKFIGGINGSASSKAEEHFARVGMTTKVLSSPEASELAKLTETTYFGLLIAWAQEVERYCKRFDVNYDDVVSMYEDIGYLPGVKFHPGVIGGHCVMPNIALLKSDIPSALLDAIESSNELKKDLEAASGRGRLPEESRAS